jgi:polyphosphate kinase 2 (PPK2 family)
MAKPSLATCDLSAKLGKARYTARLKELQAQLRRLELAYKFADGRAVVAIEGWDAVGKGGVIRRMMAPLDPRGYAVWPIGPPTPEEKAEHYLQRFWRKLPRKGTWALFDRSWYGRVLVERVEKLALPAEWRRAYDEINAFERILADDGVRIVKLFMHISHAEQLRRLLARIDDPMERWKMSRADIRNYELRKEYEEAVEDMQRKTSTDYAPWHVVPFEDKRYGRIDAIGHVVKVLAKGMDLPSPPLDPEVAQAAVRLAEEAGLTKLGNAVMKNAARRRRLDV